MALLKAPYSYMSKLDHGNIGYERVTEAQPISVSDTEVDLKLVGTSTMVNKRSQRVVETDQSEDFNHYTQLGKDGMLLDGSGKHYNMHGKPTMEMTSNLKARRIKPYEEIDEQDGDNLKQLFVEYLKSHGKADLVPSSAGQ